MDGVSFLLCEIVTQEQNTIDVSELVRAFSGGGDFFARAVFSTLGSVVISSKLRDFLIAPTGESVRDLKRDIEQEIIKVQRSKNIDEDLKERLSTHYKKCKGNIENLLKTISKKTAIVENCCRYGCYLTFLINIWLIASDKANSIGVLNLLCLSPLLLARLAMGRIYQTVSSEHEKLRSEFNGVREICQNQYNEELIKTESSIKSISNSLRAQ